MIGLLQRVAQARVEVGGACIGNIGSGVMVLVCAERVLGCRVFGDAEGKMNLSLRDVHGGLRS